VDSRLFVCFQVISFPSLCHRSLPAWRPTEFKGALVEEAGKNGRMYGYGYAYYLALTGASFCMVTLALVFDIEPPRRRRRKAPDTDAFGSYQQDDDEVRLATLSFYPNLSLLLVSRSDPSPSSSVADRKAGLQAGCHDRSTKYGCATVLIGLEH
jgi:hypothetical protein